MCEYPGFDLSICEKGSQEIIRLRDEILFNKQHEQETLEKYHLVNKKLKDIRLELEHKHKMEIQALQYVHNEQTKLKEAAIKALTHAGQTLTKIIFEYGQHKLDCNINELKRSGRIIDMSEEELCNCDWILNRDNLKKLVEKAQQEELTPEIEKVLLKDYMAT